MGRVAWGAGVPRVNSSKARRLFGAAPTPATSDGAQHKLPHLRASLGALGVALVAVGHLHVALVAVALVGVALLARQAAVGGPERLGWVGGNGE